MKSARQLANQLHNSHMYIVTQPLGYSLIKALFGFGVLFLAYKIARYWIEGNILYCVTYCVYLIAEVLFAYFWMRPRLPHVIIGDEGIIYHNLNYTLFVSWECISGIELSPHEGGPCLRLVRPPEQCSIEQGIREGRTALEKGIFRQSKLRPIGRYDIYNYIPLENAVKLKSSAIYQDIVRRVPGFAVSDMYELYKVKQSR